MTMGTDVETDACGAAKPAYGGGIAGRRWVRWTSRSKAAFLDELAATCNVLAAATAIGVSASSVYGLRRRDDDFADAWRAALAQGYQMLETQLVGHALAGGGPMLVNGDPERPAIDVELALRLLSEHRRQHGKSPPVGGPRARAATRADTNAAIIRKLRAIEQRLGLPPLAEAASCAAGPALTDTTASGRSAA